mmetsp:Transcript_19900/g.64080  ORF Transcript_19900/g.64080 Transcript_19900/m.64080 type:complete len:91 (-) Transcript_19900:780-1052(-)
MDDDEAMREGVWRSDKEGGFDCERGGSLLFAGGLCFLCWVGGEGAAAAVVAETDDQRAARRRQGWRETATRFPIVVLWWGGGDSSRWERA